MKKYQTSANTASMLLDYADYMAQYADMMQKLEEIEKMDLSAADEAYYIVSTEYPPITRTDIRTVNILP